MITSISNQQNTWTHTTLNEFCGQRRQSIVPSKTPDSVFELYSVPSFPTRQPEIVSGKEVGSNKQMVTSESVLLCKINPRINRAWVVGHFSQHTKIASTEWIVFPPDKRVEPRFLCYFLQQNAVRDFLASNVSGVGGSLMRVKPSTLRDFPFVYPDWHDQQRIVAEIEKQFSRLDEAVANLKRVKANLKRYKASILKAAVEGRLAPTEAELAGRECRSYETGEQLLHRTLEARRSQWKGKFIMPAGPIVRDLPELPAGWSWVSAVQACDPVVDCHNKTAPYINAGIPLVRTTNIRDGRLVLEDLRYVDQSTYEYWSRRCPPQPGDVLFTREAPMGEVGIIPSGLQLCLGQRTMLMRPSSAISAGFLLASLMSPVVKALIDRVAVGSGVKHLRVGDVERLPIPLPPLVEQHRIVAEVERRLSVIDELESAVKANLTRADRLRQSVLSQSFSGRLLGQDTKHVPDILPRFSMAAESQARYGRNKRARR